MKNNPLELFQQRISESEMKIGILKTRSMRISAIRIILFLSSLIAILYAANEREAVLVLLFMIVFIAGFSVLIKLHNKVNFQLRHQELIKQVNEEELQRLDNKLDPLYPGYEFQDETHPYTSDLDIFGDHSVFQLINRARTNGGRSIMAKWLSAPASATEIRDRQHAIEELKEDMSWQQELQAMAMHFKDSDQSIDVFLEWMKEGDILRNQPFYRLIRFAMPVLNLAAIISYLFFDVIYLVPIFTIALTLAVYARAAKEIGETFKKTGESVKVLGAYHLLIRMIEKKEVKSEFLGEIKKNFENPDIHASNAILQLKRIFTALESRSNILYLLVDILFLLDIHWVIRAERWREKYAPFASHWFEAIHNLECINSLSAHSFANPDQPFPEINSNLELLATDLGHPLISPDERVSNDFQMKDSQNIGIVTGSNMSGKSTFLRTIGVNMVLTFMGSTVCAKSFKTGQFQVFSGMRTHDSLSDHVSSFYAELQRLKQLIEMISEEKTIFFLLDEILKGTNSRDRHKGARSLILQLVDQNVKGLVSTHDLELSDIAESDQRILNLSFNSSVRGNEVYFDYKLENGVCRSFNATQLMEKMGINIRE